MDFMNIIYAVAVLGILGGVFGAVLAFAAKIFYGKKVHQMYPSLMKRQKNV